MFNPVKETTTRVLVSLLLPAIMLLSAPARADTAHPYKFGVYEGGDTNGVKGVAAFAKWSGHAPSRAVDFMAPRWTSGDGDPGYVPAAWKGTGVDVIYTITMLPYPARAGYSLAAGAAGAYDAVWRAMGETLKYWGAQNAVLRIGHEFNGNWYPWSADSDPADYAKYYQRIVTILRQVSGQHFEFDWCAGANSNSAAATQAAYPGDAYVDIIGLDVYNQWWNIADEVPAHRWNTLLTGPTGLQWQKAFAIAHHKQISFPEWGTGTQPDGHGGGDDPLFIKNMLAWMKTPVPAGQPDVAYADYWDFAASDYDAKLSDNHQPLSGVEFLKDTGPWSQAALGAAEVVAAKLAGE